MKCFCALLVLSALGCGPLMAPMGVRLSPAEQAEVDAMWDNLLTPPNRVNHDTLLDTIMISQLHATGVDELDMTSQKKLSDGRVVSMRVHFERDNPSSDSFTVKVKNSWGWTLRAERYTGAEILARINVVQSGGGPKAQEELERRMRRARAATQPIGAILDDDDYGSLNVPRVSIGLSPNR